MRMSNVKVLALSLVMIGAMIGAAHANTIIESWANTGGTWGVAETINVAPTVGSDYVNIGGWANNSFLAVRSDGGLDYVSKSGSVWSAASAIGAWAGLTNVSTKIPGLQATATSSIYGAGRVLDPVYAGVWLYQPYPGNEGINFLAGSNNYGTSENMTLVKAGGGVYDVYAGATDYVTGDLGIAGSYVAAALDGRTDTNGAILANAGGGLSTVYWAPGWTGESIGGTASYIALTHDNGVRGVFGARADGGIDLATNPNASGNAGWTFSSITGTGQYLSLAENGTTDGAFFALRSVPVPEPSTFALLAMGMAGLLAYAWKKRR